MNEEQYKNLSMHRLIMGKGKKQEIKKQQELGQVVLSQSQPIRILLQSHHFSARPKQDRQRRPLLYSVSISFGVFLNYDVKQKGKRARHFQLLICVYVGVCEKEKNKGLNHPQETTAFE